MTKVDSACQALFTGRINVAKAALMCGLTIEQMKKEFADYAIKREKEDWELDISLCWPYS